jgi:hypothetical protein
MSVGETGCQRMVSPFSRRRARHCSVSRSQGRRASAPPRRQAVSVCRRRINVSSAGSSPVVAAIWLISASRSLGTAHRSEGKRRGLVISGLDCRLPLSVCRFRRVGRCSAGRR